MSSGSTPRSQPFEPSLINCPSLDLSEETRDAARSAPIGVITAVGGELLRCYFFKSPPNFFPRFTVSAIFGWFYILALLFSIQDLDNVTNSASGQPVLQMFVKCSCQSLGAMSTNSYATTRSFTDAFGQTGATVAMVFVIICIYHCGLFSITANSRYVMCPSSLPSTLNSDEIASAFSQNDVRSTSGTMD